MRRETADGAVPVKGVAGLIGWVGLVLGLALLFYARFNAVNGVVLPFLQRAAHLGLYRLDYYLNHAVVPDSTPLFAALAAWRVDLTGPGFILPAYLLVNLLAGAGIWRLLGAGLGLPGGLPRAALLFALAFADFKLVGFNKSSWLGEHNFSFTFVAVALRIWVLAALFEARYARAAALVVLVNLLSFKVGWPLVGFLALLALPQGLGGWRVWLLLALSLVWPGLAALHSAHLAPGEAGLVYHQILALHPEEDNPFAGPAAQWLLVPAGLALGWWLSRLAPPRAQPAIRAVVLGSALLWLGSGFYFAVLARWWPLPVAVLLSPARAMESAALIAYLLALVALWRTPALSGLERLAALVALMVLKVTPDGKWLKLALLLALGTVVLWALRRWLERQGRAEWLPGARLDPALGLALLAPLIGAFFVSNIAGNRLTYRLDPVLGFHDAAIPAGALALLRAEAEGADGDLLLAISPAKGWQLREWHYQARRSGLTGDPYYLARASEIAIQTERNALGDATLAGLRAGQVAPATSAALARARVRLLVPASAQAALPGWRAAAAAGGWVILVPAIHRAAG